MSGEFGLVPARKMMLLSLRSCRTCRHSWSLCGTAGCDHVSGFKAYNFSCKFFIVYVSSKKLASPYYTGEAANSRP
ncbi:MAG: hypothetical protein IJS39_16895 [Synergistaceae bacterium]|nr:hypothetical protein [Synergistaceae bacterium]